MNRYSILIDCPDSYFDVFEIFLKYMHKNWPDCPADIFVTTNSFCIDGLSNIHFLKCGEGLNSIQRSEVALNIIEDEYIFILDCDCFISKPVDNDEIDSIIKFAKENDAKYIRVWKTVNEEQTIYPSMCEGFFKCNRKARYSKSLMANLWEKKEYEKEVIRSGLDGWQLESKWLSEATNNQTGCISSYYYYSNDPFRILHAVSKGKWIRTAYKDMKKQSFLTEKAKNRRLLGIKQTMKHNISSFFKNHFSSKTIQKIKKIIGKNHFESSN